MPRLKALFRQKDFHVLLFHVSIVLFGWPIVSFHSIERVRALFIYLFVVWAVVICLLYLVSRSVDVEEASQSPGKPPENDTPR